MNKLFLYLGSVFISTQSIAAVSLGDIKTTNNVPVKSIYTGLGPTYVTFDTTAMIGCNGSNSGYLTPSWASAMPNLKTNDDEANRMLSTLLAAKATKAKVIYNINSNGTGWDKCAIRGITLL